MVARATHHFSLTRYATPSRRSAIVALTFRIRCDRQRKNQQNVGERLWHIVVALPVHYRTNCLVSFVFIGWNIPIIDDCMLKLAMESVSLFAKNEEERTSAVFPLKCQSLERPKGLTVCICCKMRICRRATANFVSYLFGAVTAAV